MTNQTASLYEAAGLNLQEAQLKIETARHALLLEILYKAKELKRIGGGEELLESTYGRLMLHQRGTVMVQFGDMSSNRFEAELAAETEVLEASGQLFALEDEVWAASSGAEVLNLHEVDWRAVYRGSIFVAQALHDTQRYLQQKAASAEEHPLTGELFLQVRKSTEVEAETANALCEKLAELIDDHYSNTAELQEIAPLAFWQNCAAEDWMARVEQARAALESVRRFGISPAGEHDEDVLQQLLKELRFTEL